MQVELHPFLPQTELRKYCSAQGIAVQAYSSLGSPDSQGELLHHEGVIEAAAKLECTAAQVLLLWTMQQSIPVIPKSTDREHIIENFDAFLKLDTCCTEEEEEEEDGSILETASDSVAAEGSNLISSSSAQILSKLNQLDKGKAFCWDPSVIK